MRKFVALNLICQREKLMQKKISGNQVYVYNEKQINTQSELRKLTSLLAFEMGKEIKSFSLSFHRFS